MYGPDGSLLDIGDAVAPAAAAAVEERGSEGGGVASWAACAVLEAAELCKRSWFISSDSIEGPDA